MILIALHQFNFSFIYKGISFFLFEIHRSGLRSGVGTKKQVLREMLTYNEKPAQSMKGHCNSNMLGIFVYMQ